MSVAGRQTRRFAPRNKHGKTLPASSPTAVAFLDETGLISQDRFFAVGVLKHSDPTQLLREVGKVRNRHEFHTKNGREFKFSRLTGGTLPIYTEAAELVAKSEATFACFVVDTAIADPLSRFGGPWRAYAKLAAQLLHGSTRPREIVTVLADSYSTPDTVTIEQDIRDDVNRRFDRLAISAVVREDSRASDGLQLADLMLGAVVFEFREAAGYGTGAEKRELSQRVRAMYGVASCRPECADHPKLSVRVLRPN
jgi:hypothetical protein